MSGGNPHQKVTSILFVFAQFSFYFDWRRAGACSRRSKTMLLCLWLTPSSTANLIRLFDDARIPSRYTRRGFAVRLRFAPLRMTGVDKNPPSPRGRQDNVANLPPNVKRTDNPSFSKVFEVKELFSKSSLRGTGRRPVPFTY